MGRESLRNRETCHRPIEKTIIIWLGQSFFGTIPEKNQPRLVFLIKPFGNYSQTDRQIDRYTS